MRYIGKANNPSLRLKGHMREVRRRRTPLYDWLGKHGWPEMRILERDCADWREAERRLIAAARVRGERLLNVADGGDEPHCPLSVRRANGRLVASIRKISPEMETVRLMKSRVMQILRCLERYGAKTGDYSMAERRRAKMRLLAETHPAVFGSWASV